MATTRAIWCCACGREVAARLTTGAEIYPHRLDLAERPRWRCDGCGLSVGCHDKTADPTRPLGVIATPDVRWARSCIHEIMDPIWREGLMSRRALYARLTKVLGRQYHTAELRSIDEARVIYRALITISRELTGDADGQAAQARGAGARRSGRRLSRHA